MKISNAPMGIPKKKNSVSQSLRSQIPPGIFYFLFRDAVEAQRVTNSREIIFYFCFFSRMVCLLSTYCQIKLGLRTPFGWDLMKTTFFFSGKREGVIPRKSCMFFGGLVNQLINLVKNSFKAFSSVSPQERLFKALGLLMAKCLYSQLEPLFSFYGKRNIKIKTM